MKLTPALAGRLAFWNGRPIWANPYIDQQAAEWRDAWCQAQATFLAIGGQSTDDLERLRPRDLPGKRIPVYRRMTRLGAAAKSAKMRQQGIGWR